MAKVRKTGRGWQQGFSMATWNLLDTSRIDPERGPPSRHGKAVSNREDVSLATPYRDATYHALNLLKA